MAALREQLAGAPRELPRNEASRQEGACAGEARHEAAWHGARWQEEAWREIAGHVVEPMRGRCLELADLSAQLRRRMNPWVVLATRAFLPPNRAFLRPEPCVLARRGAGSCVPQ